jgi:hypothetical protein
MHAVLGGLFRFHWKKGAGAHMKRHEMAGHAAPVEGGGKVRR